MGSAKPKVSIIIPHYNQVECLKRLLPSIANQTFQNYEVIIIDDFTPDKSAPVCIRSLIKDYPKMRLVENAENMRFVRTCNKGIKLAKGDYICLLNQDTEVKSNFVQRNVEIMDADPSVGASSCIVVDKDGKNWFTGGRFESGFTVNLVDDFQGIRTVDWVAGTASFYRREVFDKVGLFDEDFLMYHEDVEFGLRMKAKTNYKSCMFAEKLVIHYVMPSIPRGDLFYYLTRNRFILAKRYDNKYIPKILLHDLRQTARLLYNSVTTWNLTPFSLSLYMVRGTLAGLIRRQ
ncbi:MAG: glycosyltransferase family 2 protein [Chloroflexi bacterium]|nr:glycosyltransferase family 2 protein [Chloroflexota bacterium]